MSTAAPENTAGKHFNKITQKWESPDAYVVQTQQDASTSPGDSSQPAAGVSFGDQVRGNAKKFAGKIFGKDYEVAQGEALMKGEGVDGAVAAGERVKQQQS